MVDNLNPDADAALASLRAAIAAESGASGRIAMDPETIEQDLARLVLGLMDFLRELMELRAIRRMEAGSLTDEEEERLGLALMRAEKSIHDIAARFDLTPEDLSLDLGILGRSH